MGTQHSPKNTSGLTPAPNPVRNLFAREQPSGSLLVAPSVLSADFGCLADQCAAALDAGADLLHLDVMDGHFVPNLTMGPDLCGALRTHIPNAMLDVHLMVTNPVMHVKPFADAGADHITFHTETVEHDAALTLRDMIRSHGMTAGLAINPPTNIEPHLDLFGEFDLSLVMSVNPGYSGQKFIADMLHKVRTLRARYGDDVLIEMDGGLGTTTLPDAIDAGCRVAVAGSAFFGQPTTIWTDLCAHWKRGTDDTRAVSAHR